MKKQYIIYVFLISLLSHGDLMAQKNKLFPKNELYKDKGLTNLICKLQYALVKKDKNFILSIIDNNIENGFDGNKGVEEFKRIWKLDSGGSEIWLVMSKIRLCSY